MDRRRFLQQTGLCAAGAALAAHMSCAGNAPAAETPAPASGPLRVHPENRRYFADASGRAVYLTGSHTWANIVDHGETDPPPKFDFGAYLDYLARHGHNFTRLWTWELTDWDLDVREWGGPRRHTVQPHPFARTGPGNALDGKPKFDLTNFDPAYFERLRSRVEAAGQRGIYTSVMLFEGWGIQFVTDAWKRHPFHPANNINGIGGDVVQGVDIHAQTHPKVTALQETYLRKAVDTLNGLDNLLYEVSNENHAPSTEWQYHVIRFVKEYQRTKAKQHPVGMTFQYTGGSNKTLFDSPADWISPNPDGGYNADPPAADGRKVILNDTDHLWGLGGNAPWVWKTFLRGMNPLFMDTYDGVVLGVRFDPRYEPIRKAMGVTLRVARQLDLAAMTPRGELASSGYCLAGQGKPGVEYVVYVPEGKEVSVDLAAAQGQLAVEWVDPVSGKMTSGGQADGGGNQKFASPVTGDAVLWLRPSSHARSS